MASIGRPASGVKKHQGAAPTQSLGRRKGETDLETRARIAAWIRYEMRARARGSEDFSQREFASLVGVSHTYINRVLSEVQTAGMELLLALNRKLGIDLNKLCNRDPPEEFFKQGSEKP